MALNNTGQLSAGGPTVGESINLELGKAQDAVFTMDEAAYREMLGVASGTIDMDNAHGKEGTIYIVVNVGSTNSYVANTAKAGASYSAGKTDITFNITGNIGATSRTAYAFTVDTSWHANDTVRVIVNSGVYVVGAGGRGGQGYGNSNTVTLPPLSGGHALNIQRPILLTNNGHIGGGGGGGGGSSGGTATLNGGTPTQQTFAFSGGDGGGGAGKVAGVPGSSVTPNPGSPVANSGTLTTGGNGDGPNTGYVTDRIGGNGGNLGQAGNPGAYGQWAGQSGGKYAVGYSYITWVSPGTVYGGQSG